MILVIDDYIVKGNEDEIISFIKRYRYENEKNRNNDIDLEQYKKLFGIKTKENKDE